MSCTKIEMKIVQDNLLISSFQDWEWDLTQINTQINKQLRNHRALQIMAKGKNVSLNNSWRTNWRWCLSREVMLNKIIIKLLLTKNIFYILIGFMNMINSPYKRMKWHFLMMILGILSSRIIVFSLLTLNSEFMKIQTIIYLKIISLDKLKSHKILWRA